MEITTGTVVADRFRLVRALGQGGMGAVWLARHTALDTPCAVKFIHEEAARSPELRARFEREARAAALLRSPHVVQILDHGVWQDVPYIAMEYLEGEDLGQRLRRRGALSPHETLAVAVHVGRALTKAHAAGLVHRDLKPANLFIVRDEDHEIAKVLDFGVAKVRRSGLDGGTKTGAILGTPYYMSPEQARASKDIDHRSDLWALAVVVYQCLTGRLPFLADTLYELFNKIITDPLPVPSQAAPVPPSFDAWWARAAARDPGQRFQTAKELTDALGLALGVIVPEGMEVGMSAAGPEARWAPPGGAAHPVPGGCAPTPSGASMSVRRPRYGVAAAAVAALVVSSLGALALRARLYRPVGTVATMEITTGVSVQPTPTEAPETPGVRPDVVVVSPQPASPGTEPSTPEAKAARAPRQARPRARSPKPEPAHVDPPKPEPAHVDPPKPEPAHVDPPKPEPAHVDPPKPGPPPGGPPFDLSAPGRAVDPPSPWDVQK